MRAWLGLALLFLIVPTIDAAVTVDSVATMVETSGTSHASASFTIAANTNRLLLVQITIASFPNHITGCLWSAQALTSLIESTGASNGTAFWYLKNPNAATGTVVCTSDSAFSVGVGALSLHTVHQTTTFRTSAASTGSGTPSGSCTITDSASGDFAVDAIYEVNVNTVTDLVPGGSQTQRYDVAIIPIVTTSQAAMSTLPASGAGATMTWTWSMNGGYAQVCTALVPFTASSPKLFTRRRR